MLGNFDKLREESEDTFSARPEYVEVEAPPAHNLEGDERRCGPSIRRGEQKRVLIAQLTKHELFVTIGLPVFTASPQRVPQREDDLPVNILGVNEANQA